MSTETTEKKSLTREELRNKIVLFLNDKTDYTLTIKIAQGVLGPKATRKDVNSVLDHELEKMGLVTKQCDEPTKGNPRFILTSTGKELANELMTKDV
jgi:hypothetical protein